MSKIVEKIDKFLNEAVLNMNQLLKGKKKSSIKNKIDIEFKLQKRIKPYVAELYKIIMGTNYDPNKEEHDRLLIQILHDSKGHIKNFEAGTYDSKTELGHDSLLDIEDLKKTNKMLHRLIIDLAKKEAK